MNLAAILKKVPHHGFSSGTLGRLPELTIQNHPVKINACIIFCTVHVKNCFIYPTNIFFFLIKMLYFHHTIVYSALT